MESNTNVYLVGPDGRSVYPHETILRDENGHMFKMDSWEGDYVYVVPFGEGASKGFRSKAPIAKFGLTVRERIARCPICAGVNCKNPHDGRY